MITESTYIIYSQRGELSKEKEATYPLWKHYGGVNRRTFNPYSYNGPKSARLGRQARHKWNIFKRLSSS